MLNKILTSDLISYITYNKKLNEYISINEIQEVIQDFSKKTLLFDFLNYTQSYRAPEYINNKKIKINYIVNHLPCLTLDFKPNEFCNLLELYQQDLNKDIDIINVYNETVLPRCYQFLETNTKPCLFILNTSLNINYLINTDTYFYNFLLTTYDKKIPVVIVGPQ